MTRLSCHAFRHNAVRLHLHALAYNLANFLRKSALPEEIEHWSLTTLREKLVMIGARTVCHGRYLVFQLAEVAVPRALFAAILRPSRRPGIPPEPSSYRVRFSPGPTGRCPTPRAPNGPVSEEEAACHGVSPWPEPPF